MTNDETRAILTVALQAAFADGEKHARERDEIRRIAEGFGGTSGSANLSGLYQDVLMKRATLDSTLPALATPESRQLAYEMAVCVCDADGTHSPAEHAFLDRLRGQLGLAADSAAFVERAEGLAAAPLSAGTAMAAAGAAGAVAAVRPTSPGTTATAAGVSTDDAALDKTILDAAILNGALELLPETLSTLAIIPLQMRLVYRIGQAHGVELDRGHIKDFLATAGVGLTSQYLEQAGRKLLGGLLGKVGGGLVGGLGRQAVSSGMSFATTYALGHVAKRYYAGGRTLSTQMLRQAFDGVVEEGRKLQTTYLPQIRQRASTLDAAQVMALVKGRV